MTQAPSPLIRIFEILNSVIQIFDFIKIIVVNNSPPVYQNRDNLDNTTFADIIRSPKFVDKLGDVLRIFFSDLLDC